MATIRKRVNKNGKESWQAIVYVGLDENGEEIRRYVTCDSKKEAKQKAREMENELEDGNYINVGKVKVTKWIEDWMEINKTRLSPATFALYRSYEKNHFAPYFGRFKLGQLNDIHIQKFMGEKLATQKRASVRRMMSALRIILHDALKHKNPAKDIKLPTEEKYTPRVLTETEMQTIHDAVRGTRDEPIVLLAAWCGLRRGEIFALKWNDVNWQRGTLRVDESYAVTENNLYVDKRPKSENGLREVVVPEYLLNLLEVMRRPKPKKKRKKEPEPEPANVVAIADNSDHRIFAMRPDSYSSYWAKFIRDTKLPDDKKLPQIRFHDLRHYHASWLYARGIPDQYAAQRLGHDIRVLKTIYQHLGLDRQVEIDDNIRQMYGAKKEEKEAEKKAP